MNLSERLSFQQLTHRLEFLKPQSIEVSFVSGYDRSSGKFLIDGINSHYAKPIQSTGIAIGSRVDFSEDARTFDYL